MERWLTKAPVIVIYIYTIYSRTSGISRFFVDILVLAFITQKSKPSKKHHQITGFSIYAPFCHPGALAARGSTSHFGHENNEHHIDDEIIGYQSSTIRNSQNEHWISNHG